MLVTVLVGCYHPSAVTGVPCSEGGHCPAGQQCDHDQQPPICVGEPSGEVDAGITCGDTSGCPADAPICADHTCRPCAADSECPSDVCHELAGTCVDEARALYVAPSGIDNATCSRAQPCASVEAALINVTATRTTIKVADGTYGNGFRINTSIPIVISGADADADGASFDGSQNLTPETGSLAIALIEGVTLRASRRDGFLNRGDLGLYRVLVTGSQQAGISSRGKLWLRECRIEGSTGLGITIMGGTPSAGIDARRVVIVGNTGGGIMVANASFSILSSVIADNGSTTATNGGVRLQSFGLPPPAVFRFNTVAGNRTGGAVAPGIQCDQPATIEDSIIAANAAQFPAPPPFTELSAACTARYSLFLTTAPNGVGNLTGDPLFGGNGDYHLRPRSPAIGAADPDATEPTDVDGDVRPAGQMDIGADEVP
jgi:hypothetical protein